MVAAGPARGGFSPGFAACHSAQIRSISAWCIQNTGSHGAVGIDTIDPPTQTWPEWWIPSRAPPNALKVPLASAAATAAAFGSVAKAPMLRVTVWGPVPRTTVGVNPRSHEGKACSSLDRQYGRHTVGSIDMTTRSILARSARGQGR